MQWTELANGEWTLPAARTKNRREHILALPEAVRVIFEEMPRGQAGSFIFSTTDGRKPVVSYYEAKQRLDRLMAQIAAEEAGAPVDIPAFRNHDLRRAAATGMARIGVQPHVIEATLNHSSGIVSGLAGT